MRSSNKGLSFIAVEYPKGCSCCYPNPCTNSLLHLIPGKSGDFFSGLLSGFSFFVERGKT